MKILVSPKKIIKKSVDFIIQMKKGNIVLDKIVYAKKYKIKINYIKSNVQYALNIKCGLATLFATLIQWHKVLFTTNLIIFLVYQLNMLKKINMMKILCHNAAASKSENHYFYYKLFLRCSRCLNSIKCTACISRYFLTAN